MAVVQTCYESAAVWSDATAMQEQHADPTPLRRGQVWLADTAAARCRRVVVIAAGAGDGNAAIVAPVAHGVTPRSRRVALPHTAGAGDRAFVDVSRLRTLPRADLVALVATLPDERLREIDAVLRDVLGLGAAEPEIAAAPAATLKPRAALLPPPQQVQAWAPATEATRLEDHPMARLFGQTPPAVPAPAPDDPPRGRDELPSPGDRAAAYGAAARDDGAARATPAAVTDRREDALPALLDVVRRRLHRSSPHLEGLIVDAVHQGRSVEWAAAAVRRASVRGVMQSTLDDIAAEMEAVDARGQAAG